MNVHIDDVVAVRLQEVATRNNVSFDEVVYQFFAFGLQAEQIRMNNPQGFQVLFDDRTKVTSPRLTWW